MQSVNIYLNFKGNTEEAFNFYKSIFGCEFDAVMRYGDSKETSDVPENDKKKIMHISMTVKNLKLMGTDLLSSMEQDLKVGNNISIMIVPDDKLEANKLYAALSEGGKKDMPMQDMFWGDYFGSLTDKFGITWMLDVAS